MILAISGSAALHSSNRALLTAVKRTFEAKHKIEIFEPIRDFPLFRPEELDQPLPPIVLDFKQAIAAADGIVICTPEYTHNIPAVLKNTLEWITASGELQNKRVLAITFTPREPRGTHAMQSLLFSLNTMEARVVAQLPLYKSDFQFSDEKVLINKEMTALIDEALNLLL